METETYIDHEIWIDIHHIETRNLVEKDWVSRAWSPNPAIPIKQARAWAGDKYAEYQNVRVVRVTTTIKREVI